ncbi:MAG TPA: nitroreductase family deazaflavin-dependent oxidoreductase [Thermomicrobiales bacterium]|nr:nitroreductase family deazaflavin-dependent oxidoreductase [Thermomicrobiales bacterium]
MPMSRVVARLNRYTINPLIRRFAGSVPPFAILVHRGRRSGTEYRIPIMVFPDNDDFIIALTYGRTTDWARNVLHAGGCDLMWRRSHIGLVEPKIVKPGAAVSSLPRPVRAVLRLLGASDFMRLHRASSE